MGDKLFPAIYINGLNALIKVKSRCGMLSHTIRFDRSAQLNSAARSALVVASAPKLDSVWSWVDGNRPSLLFSQIANKSYRLFAANATDARPELCCYFLANH